MKKTTQKYSFDKRYSYFREDIGKASVMDKKNYYICYQVIVLSPELTKNIDTSLTVCSITEWIYRFIFSWNSTETVYITALGLKERHELKRWKETLNACSIAAEDFQEHESHWYIYIYIYIIERQKLQFLMTYLFGKSILKILENYWHIWQNIL